MDREAQCQCGQLRATCAGEPVRVSVCHCLDCKRRTGGAFSWNARYPEAAVTLAGRRGRFASLSDEGNRKTHWFCPDCGSTVLYALATVPGAVAVPAGAFADASFPAPQVEVYGERRVAWCAPDVAASE